MRGRLPLLSLAPCWTRRARIVAAAYRCFAVGFYRAILPSSAHANMPTFHWRAARAAAVVWRRRGAYVVRFTCLPPARAVCSLAQRMPGAGNGACWRLPAHLPSGWRGKDDLLFCHDMEFL